MQELQVCKTNLKYEKLMNYYIVVIVTAFFILIKLVDTILMESAFTST